MVSLTIAGLHSGDFDGTIWRPDIVGVKAFGLGRIPPEWTPEFFVVSTAAQEEWRCSGEDAKTLLTKDPAYSVRLSELRRYSSSIIVRSSGAGETLEERGLHDSYRCSADEVACASAVQKVWLGASESGMAALVQRYIPTVSNGHLSNERRVSERETEWMYEVGDTAHRISVRSSDFRRLLDERLTCRSNVAIEQCMRRLAAYALKFAQRVHFEWVWDGERIWLVQADLEDFGITAPPKSTWTIDTPHSTLHGLRAFVELDEANRKWGKLQTSRVIRELRLPSVPQYVLERPDLLEQLARGERPREVEDDLVLLLRAPVVIRTDRASMFELKLPRTDTVRTIAGAFEFMQRVATDCVEVGVSAADFCFLLHHFIASRASAFALAKPDDPRVRIDATWGLPESLDYFPHDSYEVTLHGNDAADIETQLRCKCEYIDVDATGMWLPTKAGPPWDWKQSLPNDMAVDVAHAAAAIADRIGTPVQVMFFIGVDPMDREVLPWVYTTEQVQASIGKSSLTWSRKRILVATPEDLSGLRAMLARPGAHADRFTIALRPDPRTVRSRAFVLSVAEIAKENGLPVELEGSVLSHNYYLLAHEGVALRCVEPFSPKPAVQRFGKLVRDRIVERIIGRGEVAEWHSASRGELLTLLRQKAVEEALELQNATSTEGTVEELADIVEIIRAVATTIGSSFEDVESMASRKRDERGGFDDGVVLEETHDAPLVPREESESSASRRRTRLSSRRPTLRGDVILIPLVPPARSDVAVHTRVSLPNVGVDVTIDYEEKDIRVEVRRHGLKTVEADSDQLSLFAKRPPKK